MCLVRIATIIKTKPVVCECIEWVLVPFSVSFLDGKFEFLSLWFVGGTGKLNVLFLGVWFNIYSNSGKYHWHNLDNLT